ncbi:MAG: Asp-tRNA(Asn)/Glu-tRNA(Gln) amidotransferase subunit GatC [Alphaproteobacteria bacterium]|nr:Asp-tRNA(Asn)/Glu-tRNA(Gln) amidotransferase subunit GatC [Alphaproteobacteria bacterium]
MPLKKEDVKKIARLSRIKVEEQEYEHIAGQLNSIMDWIDQLTAVDTSSIDAKSQEGVSAMFERADIVTAGGIVNDILANAPSSQHNMFAVPKVIE